jgi:hypothetical protein
LDKLDSEAENQVLKSRIEEFKKQALEKELKDKIRQKSEADKVFLHLC